MGCQAVWWRGPADRMLSRVVEGPATRLQSHEVSRALEFQELVKAYPKSVSFDVLHVVFRAIDDFRAKFLGPTGLSRAQSYVPRQLTPVCRCMASRKMGAMLVRKGRGGDHHGSGR